MIQNLAKSKYYLLIGAAVLLTGLFAVSCSTTTWEGSGRMPNEHASKHVKGYQMGNSDAVRPVAPVPLPR